MKKEIFIHIGFNKTGTTSIQTLLRNNADLLLQQGIYYPLIHINHSAFIYPMFVSNPEGKDICITQGHTTKHQIEKHHLHLRNVLEKKMADPKVKKIIFSAEYLPLLNAEEILKLQRWLSQFSDNITIICCTRNPIAWYNSRIQQALKMRKKNIGAIGDAFCFNTRKTSYLCLEKYMQCFGEKNVIVYDFDKHRGNLYKKFLSACCINSSLSTELLKKSIQIENESLSAECCMILNSLNEQQPLKPNAKAAFQEASYLYGIKGEKFKAPNKVLEKILAQHAKEIKWLAESFPKECGDYPIWPQLLKERTENQTLFQDEALKSLAMLISDLANENKSLGSMLKSAIKAKLKYFVKKAPLAKKIYTKLTKEN